MYDYVFSEQASQEEVYHTTTSPLIKDVLKGLSAAVFAYGATGEILGVHPQVTCLSNDPNVFEFRRQVQEKRTQCWDRILARPAHRPVNIRQKRHQPKAWV